jgi:predicted  nucleic acid-binding Zn-ribbon protein
MIITSVCYSRLKNLGNYENERLDATTAVLEGQTPEDVHHQLKEWVHQQLGLSSSELQQEVQQLEDRRYDLRNDIQAIERRLEKLKQQWRDAKTLLTIHGIDVPDFPVADDPPTANAVQTPF